MRLFRSARSLLFALLAASAAAQVTGVPGINDYTINGFVSGSTSCTPMCFPTGGIVLNLNVSTAPGNPVLVLFSDCPCRGCSFPWFPNTCTPAIPPAFMPPCNSTTNQSIDIFLLATPCSIVWSQFLFANAAGQANLILPVPTFTTPPCTQVLSTQAVVFDVCGTGGNPPGPGPFVMTQAYSVAF